MAVLLARMRPGGRRLDAGGSRPRARAGMGEPRALASRRMLDAEDVRRLALALPGALEADHHGRPSFRVGGRIFATLWTPTALNVMAGEEEIRAAVARAPDVYAPV